ncbi:MAG: GMC family oxidoreductase [Agarilytica sp.]
MLHKIPQDKITDLAEAQAQKWDVVIIGAGMGGGTAAYVLANAGLKVLVLDKGAANFDGDEESVSIEPNSEAQQYINGKWPTQIRTKINGADHDMWAPLGCGMGGSSLLYAAALQRFRRSDFEHRKAPNGEHIGWPFSYEEVEPYYQRCEQLFSVRGTPDPLEKNVSCSLNPPPAMCEQDQHFFGLFKAAGYNPYRLHVGVKYEKDCGECGGHICKRSCKRDAYNSCIVPALSSNNVYVAEYADVQKLDTENKSISTIHVMQKNKRFEISGKIVVLSAGAYFTPTLLLKSSSNSMKDGLANSSKQVGKNLMFHASDYLGIWPQKKCSRIGPNKTIAIRDLYELNGEKAGEIQSTGLAADFGLIMYSLRLLFDQSKLSKLKPLRHFLRIPAYIASKLYGEATVFTTIVEDFPYSENRIVVDDTAPSGMRFEYTIHEELKNRVASMRHHMRHQMKNLRVLPLNLTVNLNYGHPCGTARAGEDPATSVVDKDCKAHDLDNLYIVDASIMPTSGGTNPSLTIAANAMRVAEKIAQRLTQPDTKRPV